MNSKKNHFQTPAIEQDTIEILSQKLLISNAMLTQANQRLEHLQKEREVMLANISHDLRAPITAIRSAVDYLTSGQDIQKEDYHNAIQLIDHRTQTLENLIQDMYYLFCVEDTSKELELTSIQIAPFLEEYFFDATMDSLYEDHEMILDLPETLDCTLCIDVQKMIRVLDNLFTNAAKYSGSGSRITLKAEFSQAHKHLLISVIDNGIGIPADSLSQLFNRTYTVSTSRTPGSSTGSGLGLSIVKAIVERHGGGISCKSKIGAGSCFQILLPIQSE